MFEELILIIIGAILAVFGGFIERLYSTYKERKIHLNLKREEAYLGYIRALLLIREKADGSVEHKQNFTIINEYRPMVYLYGSLKAVESIKKYEQDLYECWECGCNINDMITKGDKIIDYLRRELKV